MQKFWAELSPRIDPQAILKLFTTKKNLTITDLTDKNSCMTLSLGKSIGSGSNASVYVIKEKDNQGIEVVVKKIIIKESMEIKNDVIILNQTLSEIVMSSYFNQLYQQDNYYSVNFPYFQGFFSCGHEAFLIMETLQTTLYDYLYSSNFRVDLFIVLLFQLSFSLLLMQKEKIMHNDLHSRNLMLVSTKNKYYRGHSLQEKLHYYREGENVYELPNLGHILKFLDFDFSCRHSTPKLCPKKLFYRPVDNWNVQYEWRPFYDLMTISMFLVDALFVRKAISYELDKARIFLRDWIKDFSGLSVEEYKKQFHVSTNRPLPGKEFPKMQLKLSFWEGKVGIRKTKNPTLVLNGSI